MTEHLVLRGSYKSLTLVIYGNLAKELCLDRNRAAFVSSSKSTFNVDTLQEVLDTQFTAGSALSSLQLICPPTAEQGQLFHRFLKCLGGADPDRNLVSVLLMAAAALHVPLQISVNGAHWIAAKKLDPLDSPVDPVVDDINVEVQELRDWVQQREEEGKHTSTEEGAEQSLLSISQTWLQAGLDSSCGLNTPLSAVLISLNQIPSLHSRSSNQLCLGGGCPDSKDMQMSWFASPSTIIYLYIYTCLLFIRCVLDGKVGASCVNSLM